MKKSERKISFFSYLLTWKKPFNRVPKEVIRFALKRKGVPEYLVNGGYVSIKVVKLLPQLMGNYQVHSFSVKVGVH